MAQQQTPSIAARTALGAGWVIGWRMATRLLGLISTLVLARILVPADFGLVALATVSAGAIDALSVIGLEDALIRDHESSRSLNDTAFTLTVGRGIVNGLIVALLAYPASVWFNEPRLASVLFVLALLTVLAGFENIGVVAFRRELQFQKEFLLLLPSRIVGVAVTIALGVWLHSYWALVAGIAVTRLMRLGMTYWMHPYRPRLALTRWRHLVGFSFWTWAAGIALFAWDRAETIVLGHTLGSQGVGLFLVAIEIAVLPTSEFVSPVARALFAGFSAAQREGRDLLDAGTRVAAALMVVVMPLALVVSAAAGDLTRVLLGQQWLAAQPLIAVLAAMSLPAVLTKVFGTVLTARAHVRASFSIVALSATAKIPVLYAVALTGDLRGVAVVSVGAAFVEALLYCVTVKRFATSPVPILTFDLARTLVAGLAGLGVLYATGLGWDLPPGSPYTALVHGFVVGVVGLATFSAVQLALWFAAGRPDGGETQILRVLTGLIGAFRGRRQPTP